MMVKYLFFFAALLVQCSAQSEQSLSNMLEKVSLPPELQGKLPSELEGKVDSKYVEEMQNKALNEFKTRCERNGGPDAYATAQNGTQDLYKCFNRLVNTTTLQQEVEEAKPHGEVDEVFKKYCDKNPQFESCVVDFMDSTASCFSEEEQNHLKTVYNVSQQLVEFICFKDGDRIALFIAEGGQECFQDKRDGLRECFNKTMGFQADFDISSLSEATLSFDEKQCQQMYDLQKCVVEVLVTCPKPTSANIVESLFKFIRKSTPCKNYDVQKGGAATFYVTAATLVTSLAVTVMV